ncbi:MAG: hypothetical protein ACFE89_08570 [Candidatus Hodarchaeota archaeon]
MDRNLASFLSAVIILILFVILAGLNLIPLQMAMWLPLLGLLLCSLIIGWGGTYRTVYLLIYSFLIYMGLMLFLAINATFLSGQVFGPLSFSQINDAWSSFQGFVNTIPFLPFLSSLALVVRTTLGDSLLAIFLEFLVASLFSGFLALLLTGISGYLTRSTRLHVVTAPETPSELPESPIPSSPPAVPTPHTATAPVQTVTPPMAPSQTPPAFPPPRPVEDALPPPPSVPKGGSPSAKAIAGVRGKVDKHLKGTGQKAPAGQTRCPHCQATVIQGSRFCNACQREI